LVGGKRRKVSFEEAFLNSVSLDLVELLVREVIILVPILENISVFTVKLRNATRVISIILKSGIRTIKYKKLAVTKLMPEKMIIITSRKRNPAEVTIAKKLI
jgi:hypothetical protein